MRSLQIWYRLLAYPINHALLRWINHEPVPRLRLRWEHGILVLVLFVPDLSELLAGVSVILVPFSYVLGLVVATQLSRFKLLHLVFTDSVVQTTPPGKNDLLILVTTAHLRRKKLFFDFSLNQLIGMNLFAVSLVASRFVHFSLYPLALHSLTWYGQTAAYIGLGCAILYLELRQNVVLGILSAWVAQGRVFGLHLRAMEMVIYAGVHIITWAVSLVVTLTLLRFALSPYSVVAGILTLYGSREFIIWRMDRCLKSQ